MFKDLERADVLDILDTYLGHSESKQGQVYEHPKGLYYQPDSLLIEYDNSRSKQINVKQDEVNDAASDDGCLDCTAQCQANSQSMENCTQKECSTRHKNTYIEGKAQNQDHITQQQESSDKSVIYKHQQNENHNYQNEETAIIVAGCKLIQCMDGFNIESDDQTNLGDRNMSTVINVETENGELGDTSNDNMIPANSMKDYCTKDDDSGCDTRSASISE